MDIDGYSKLVIDKQTEVSSKLSEITRNSEQFRRAESEGRLVRFSTTAASRAVAIASLATFLFLPPHFDSIAPDETPKPFASPDYFGVVDLNSHFVFRSRDPDFCSDAAT